MQMRPAPYIIITIPVVFVIIIIIIIKGMKEYQVICYVTSKDDDNVIYLQRRKICPSQGRPSGASPSHGRNTLTALSVMAKIPFD